MTQRRYRDGTFAPERHPEQPMLVAESSRMAAELGRLGNAAKRKKRAAWVAEHLAKWRAAGVAVDR